MTIMPIAARILAWVAAGAADSVKKYMSLKQVPPPRSISAHAAIHAHMRAAIGMIVIEFPSPYATDAMDYLNKGIALRDLLREEPLLSFCIAPHAPYTVSDKTFERIAVM